MNISYCIRKREEFSSPIRNYDIAIERLKCYASNEYSSVSISPNESDTIFPESPFFASKFCQLKNHEHILALAGEDGIVALHNTRKRNYKNYIVSGFVAHHNAIFDITWMYDDMHLVTGSGDHSAKLWDVTITPRLIRKFQCHNRSIKTVTSRPDDPHMFASGGRDGMVLLWDTRCYQETSCIKPENAIFIPHQTQLTSREPPAKIRKHTRNIAPSRASSITCLVFQDVHTLISCSAGDGKIKIWDLRKNYWCYRGLPLPLYTLSHPKSTGRIAFSSLVLDPGRVRLYASSLDDTIYCYNVSTYEKMPISTYTGHHNSTFYVKACLSPDGTYLVSGSSNGKACIWNVKSASSQPLVHLVGHEDEVMNVAWCPVDDIKVITCCEDGVFRIWHVGLDDESENDEQLVGWAEVNVQKTSLESSMVMSQAECLSTEHTVSDTSSQASNIDIHNDDFDEERQLKRKVLDSISLRVSEDSNTNNPDIPNISKAFTPTKISGSFNLSSPTSNLPNFVADGMSSHHHCSPMSRLKENVDWLTRLKKEKSASKSPSPKTQGVPKRKTTRSQSNPDGRRSPRGSLLKYFKVADKSDLH